MNTCPPDCPNIQEVDFHEDLMSRKKSTRACKKYKQRLWIGDDRELERLDHCELEFKKITTYECYFTFGTRELVVDCNELQRSYGIDEFSHGFWINDDLKFTKGSDCLFWIPPSKIHHVKKVEKEVINEEG